MNDTFRITTLATDRLRAQLDVNDDSADALDEALDEAGYARLDHGMAQTATTAIMAFEAGMGRDPGHRAPAIALTRALLFIVQADGHPDDSRLAEVADSVGTLTNTDDNGKRIIEANIAYARGRAIPQKPIPNELAEHGNLRRTAKEVYANASYQGVVTDVAFERALIVGRHINGWEDALWAARPPHEPMTRTRRHDPSQLERFGISPPLAELISWVKAHPEVDAGKLEGYAKTLGLDRQAIADGMEQATRLIGGPTAKPHQGY